MAIVMQNKLMGVKDMTPEEIIYGTLKNGVSIIRYSETSITIEKDGKAEKIFTDLAINQYLIDVSYPGFDSWSNLFQ